MPDAGAGRKRIVIVFKGPLTLKAIEKSDLPPQVKRVLADAVIASRDNWRGMVA